jgi:hypothetical protein
MCLNGAIPLFYELGAESAFPVSEGVVGGFLTWLNNVFGIIFLFMLQIPGIGWCHSKIRMLFKIKVQSNFTEKYADSYGDEQFHV